MTREELVAEIQTLQAFSQTWACRNVRILDKTEWYRYCYDLMIHYLSDKEEIEKADLMLFDVLYPSFSQGITNVTYSKEQVIGEYLQELTIIRNQISLVEDRMLYSYDVNTGKVECLDIMVRYKNNTNAITGKCNFKTDYELFKTWLFTTLTKHGQIPGVDKRVYYIDSAEWEIIKENFPRMVKRLTVGSTDIFTFNGYYDRKKREKELEAHISKIETHSEDATYIRILPHMVGMDKFKKLNNVVL